MFYPLFADIRSDEFSMQNKLNVNAPEFTVNRDVNTGEFFLPNSHFLQHSKSSGNIRQKFQLDNQFFGLSEHSPCKYLLCNHSKMRNKWRHTNRYFIKLLLIDHDNMLNLLAPVHQTPRHNTNVRFIYFFYQILSILLNDYLRVPHRK